MATVGIHIVTTTFGTWLPGDDRGHWSPLFDMYGQLLERGCKLNLPDQTTQTRARALMNEPPKYLDDHEQQVVADILAGLAAPPPHSPGLGRGPQPYSPGLGRGPHARGPVSDGAPDDSISKPRPRPGLYEGTGGELYPYPVCYAAAIEHNHAHFLFGPIAENLDRFVGRLKGMSSSAVL
ncbi:MAG: hypothetical protein IT445_08380 [Phycisphaeraceae bacterium]|nr:hypothetical protein [Phycisphaeraceae bacterium]